MFGKYNPVALRPATESSRAWYENSNSFQASDTNRSTAMAGRQRPSSAEMSSRIRKLHIFQLIIQVYRFASCLSYTPTLFLLTRFGTFLSCCANKCPGPPLYTKCSSFSIESNFFLAQKAWFGVIEECFGRGKI
jgi:hypothetical protein